MRVLIFGDSITYGALDTQGGWADRLKHHYAFKHGGDRNIDVPSVYNQGISGDTAEGVVKRFDIETSARSSDELSFIIAIGTNDSVLENGRPKFSEEQYQDNLRGILAKAKKHSERIMIVGLLPVIEKLTTPIPWRPERHYVNKRIKLFNEAASKVAYASSIPFVELYETFEARTLGNPNLFPDGLHPNDEGHQLIFELVRPRLDKLLNT